MNNMFKMANQLLRNVLQIKYQSSVDTSWFWAKSKLKLLELQLTPVNIKMTQFFGVFLELIELKIGLVSIVHWTKKSYYYVLHYWYINIFQLFESGFLGEIAVAHFGFKF